MKGDASVSVHEVTDALGDTGIYVSIQPPTPKARYYKGWRIEPRNRHGWYVATDHRGGYFKELRADTLAGIKQFITHTIESE